MYKNIKHIPINLDCSIPDELKLSTGKPHITYSRIATPYIKDKKSLYNDNSSCNLI